MLTILTSLRMRARPLARIGCVSIGTVYVLVGSLALLALSGRLIEAADEERVVQLLLDIPGGALVIWGIVVGATAYVAWRIIEAVSDPYGFGAGWRGLTRRFALASSAIGYALIGFTTARIALGSSNAARDAAEEQQQLIVGQVLGWPGGELLIGIAGAVLAVVGVTQFVLVARRAYATEIRIEPQTELGERVTHFLAWYGYSARGVILCVLAWFLLDGAISSDPNAVGDTDTAFDFIGGGILGDSAFAVVAVGTIAYGIFMYMNAWHYKFDSTPEPIDGPQGSDRP
jgi:Domain of Unknown Function (DUF1206)